MLIPDGPEALVSLAGTRSIGRSALARSGTKSLCRAFACMGTCRDRACAQRFRRGVVAGLFGAILCFAAGAASPQESTKQSTKASSTKASAQAAAKASTKAAAKASAKASVKASTQAATKASAQAAAKASTHAAVKASA